MKKSNPKDLTGMFFLGDVLGFLQFFSRVVSSDETAATPFILPSFSEDHGEVQAREILRIFGDLTAQRLGQLVVFGL